MRILVFIAHFALQDGPYTPPAFVNSRMYIILTFLSNRILIFIFVNLWKKKKILIIQIALYSFVIFFNAWGKKLYIYIYCGTYLEIVKWLNENLKLIFLFLHMFKSVF